jgi:hypothetical protein
MAATRLGRLSGRVQVLYLDNQNQLIARETLFTGTINRTEVHPREVVKRALHFNAAAVILAHNHPSGETTPGQADKTLTQRLVQVLQLVDIRVPDHLIVGGSDLFVHQNTVCWYYMKIISKRQAMTIYRQHPVRSFATHRQIPVARQRLSLHRQQFRYPGVLAVYAERRQDGKGPYTCLMSITLN